MQRALALGLLLACRHAPPPAAPANRTALADRDGDGIPDVRDRCPDEPEDFDMFEDAGGCPDPDNDHDGVPDDNDSCPSTPGPGGCPPGCVIVTDSNDCFGDPWIYDVDNDAQRARIAEVVADVKRYPDIRRLTVTGYSLDAERPEAAEHRANRLRDRLVALGVPADHVVVGQVLPDPRPLSVARTSVAITKQRFADGKFRDLHCTSWGPVYFPRKATYHCP